MDYKDMCFELSSVLIREMFSSKDVVGECLPVVL